MEKNYAENKSSYQENKSKTGTVPFEVMLRRFNRQVQQNRLLSEIKKRRYHEKDLTREEKREIARHKSYIKRLKRGY